MKTPTLPQPEPAPEKEIKQWLHELTRITMEALERFDNGELLPAISSLAAIPPLHATLIENCIMASKETSPNEDDTTPPGLYL